MALCLEVLSDQARIEVSVQSWTMWDLVSEKKQKVHMEVNVLIKKENLF